MSQTVIASEILRLRKTVARDLPFVVGLEHAPRNREWIIPWPEAEHRGALEDPDLAHLVCEAVSGERQVGYLIVAGLANPNRSIEFRRLVISEKKQGYGRETIRLIKRLAFTVWNANRLWLDVKESNLRAQRLYESEGFVSEGLLRECLITDSGFESLVVMSLLRREMGPTGDKPKSLLSPRREQDDKTKRQPE